jgi:hypothetical protein
VALEVGSAFGGNLASVAVKMLSRVICIIRTFYIVRTFSVLKDNAAINCVSVQHKKGFVAIDFDVPYCGSKYEGRGTLHCVGVPDRPQHALTSHLTPLTRSFLVTVSVVCNLFSTCHWLQSAVLR